ncbi:uncharacterized protein PAC_12485 [Phialocephala subalpina]|uniref:Uncharacterized protein n=1 Tax=Phialocephala subalpina TaxID=576137 RepID=A0A1L7XC43_9HELO|nr:uncharacterized protein PAC_12485 [Phialocephala subalpina]
MPSDTEPETVTAKPLPGEQTTTRSPPDINPNTHILGVCGTTNIKSTAAPDEDGWMVTDLFTWKGIFKGLGASQTWMTCFDPGDLVDKYEKDHPQGPYVLGDPYEDGRAVVLSSKQLNSARQNLLIGPDTGETDFRDRFLQIFRQICIKAAETDGSVLLLIVAHGDLEVSDGGLNLGLIPQYLPKRYDPSLLLTPEMLSKALSGLPELKIITFLTSCFSGNWVITPEWTPHSDPVMASAHKNEIARSWACSTEGRFSGGVFTTYVLQELLKEAKIIEEGQDLPESKDRTWVAWYERVKSLMAQLRCRSELGGSLPQFTSTGGTSSFWSRTGYPMGRYLENWNEFPKIPKSKWADPHKSKRVRTEDVSQDDVDTYWTFVNDAHKAFPLSTNNNDRSGGSSWSGATGQRLRSKTKDLAHRYLSSTPPDETIPSNRWIFTTSNRLLAGKYDPEELTDLENALSWRLYTMDEAEKMVKVLKLDQKMVPIAKWDFAEWSGRELEGRGQESKRTVFNKNLSIVQEWPLVTQPPGVNCGPGWMKPHHYLAAAFSAN